MRVAVYGKGGIGKSTVTSNISYSLSEAGSKVIQIGCDPKCDSTKPLLKGRYQRTVTQYIRDVPPSKRRIEDIMSEGSNGILCIEAGGPSPGTGCAGKGIISMFSTLEKMGVDSMSADFTLYDVLGDVVCGGFSIPMRPNHSDVILIVTSGEYMSLFAANNIMKGSRQFERGSGRVAGLVLNRRGLKNEDAMVDTFSKATGVPVLGRIDRSDIFRLAEAKGCTVCEYDGSSPEAGAFRALAKTIRTLDGAGMESPTPLTDAELDSLYSDGSFDGRGSSCEQTTREMVEHEIPVFSAPRRIGKGPVSAVLEAGKVTDVPVVVHGTSSCGFTMLKEVSEERMSHILSDPEAYMASGGNIVCTEMTADSSVFGGQDRLRATLEGLLPAHKVVIVISTCLPGMIGDDCGSLITQVEAEHPGSRILYIDANRVDSGFDAHMEVIRALADLIDPDVQPQDAFLNVVDDNFITFNRGSNRTYLESLLSDLGMVSGPGFLNDCSIREIAGLRRFGVSALCEDGRDNRAVKGMLEAKGIRFMESPLPRGYGETVPWLAELASIRGIDGHYASAIEREYRTCIDRFSPEMSGRRVAVLSWDPARDRWIADTLTDCGCEVLVHTPSGKGSPEQFLESLPFSDAVIDCTGMGPEGAVPGPDTWLSHRASMDLIRRVWGHLMSSSTESWKTWSD